MHTKHLMKWTPSPSMGQFTYSRFILLSILGLTPLTLILPSLFIISDSMRSALTDSGIFSRLSDVCTLTSYL